MGHSLKHHPLAQRISPGAPLSPFFFLYKTKCLTRQAGTRHPCAEAFSCMAVCAVA